jgi:hypothetical protein|tara:strand:- start:288 stop:494 length:207 start_codon:yes stop_codon:yes gene_type:complete
MTTIVRTEQGGIFDACIDCVGVVGSGFKVPDLGEFPRMWCVVINLVGAWYAVVREFVADGRPRRAFVI